MAAYQRMETEEQHKVVAQKDLIHEREQEEQRTGTKRRGRKPKSPQSFLDPNALANITDPESRVMKTRHGFIQGYNEQAIVDTDSQIILAYDVTQQVNDKQQLLPMLDRCRQQYGELPRQLIADAGYFGEPNLTMAPSETELFVATTKDWKQRKKLREQGCPRGRIPDSASVKDRMERKLLTKRGRNIYNKRSQVECTFGQQTNRGLTNYLRRGLKKVKFESSLGATSHNILKMFRSGQSFT